ncbi:ImmA/IrrE family metallo-endopeptidase [Streptomyces scabiei]|uniref:ImmA/IrrE family metallo-endopeptidase n=1 Tax=Streptomyces scabiei TaxID=1930 RepID=UPI0033F529A9
MPSKGKAAERGRFDAAHGRGHLVLRGEERMPHGPRAEAEAHRFAAALLMPWVGVPAPGTAGSGHEPDPSGEATWEGRRHGARTSAARTGSHHRMAVPHSLRRTRPRPAVAGQSWQPHPEAALASATVVEGSAARSSGVQQRPRHSTCPWTRLRHLARRRRRARPRGRWRSACRRRPGGSG